MEEGKAKIQQLLKSAKMQHFNQLSSELGKTLGADKAIADMPPVRVI